MQIHQTPFEQSLVYESIHQLSLLIYLGHRDSPSDQGLHPRVTEQIPAQSTENGLIHGEERYM